MYPGGERGLNHSFSPTGGSANGPPVPTSTPLSSDSQASSGLIGTAVLNIIFSQGLYAEQQDMLRQQIIDEVFPYVLARLGLKQPSRLYTIAFNTTPNCILHGIARSDDFIAEVFTCESIASDQAMAIMAHEIAHLVSYERYGAYPAVGSDLLLVEGVATYAAARYWIGNEDLRTYVRGQRQSGVTPDLQESYRGVNAESMNANYLQWASFVEFLHEICGRDAFDQIYTTGNGSIGSASYLQYCGQSINGLEQDWKIWLQAESS
jgi:hypothetical protein